MRFVIDDGVRSSTNLDIKKFVSNYLKVQTKDKDFYVCLKTVIFTTLKTMVLISIVIQIKT